MKGQCSGEAIDVKTKRHMSFEGEDQGFDDRQCLEQVMQTQIYGGYQSKIKKRTRKVKQLKALAHSLVQKPAQTNSDEKAHVQLSDNHSKLTVRRNSNLSSPRKQELPKHKQIRVPIQYYDETRDHSIYTKKMVYKGYTPRSSYYYVKTLKDITSTLQQPKQVRKDCEVAFNSKFESGNLNYVIKISQLEYALYMREDTNTKGQRQWFYFQVTNKRACKIHFRIYKFTKYFSLYRQGAKPFVLSKKKDQQETTWTQAGQNVKYSYDEYEKCYFLEFDYIFSEQNSLTYFASLPPYTYSSMQTYLNQIVEENTCVSKRTLCHSLSGIQIPYLEIKQSSEDKQFIVILSRTHPGETVSNFALEGFLQTLFQDKKLRDKYNFVIIPMVNVDGVFFGNHRTGILGQDFNRHFNSEDEEFFPQIVAIKNLIRSIRKKAKIRFLLDLHGHSAKKGIFAYGGEEQRGSNRFLYNRIIPKILQTKINLFEYKECVFRNSREKKDTARMYFMLHQGIISTTFEQSYSLFFDAKLRKNMPIGINNWKNFGKALAQSLNEYVCLIAGKTDVPQVLKDYMPEELEEPEPQPQPEPVPQPVQMTEPQIVLDRKALKSEQQTMKTANTANSTAVISNTNSNFTHTQSNQQLAPLKQVKECYNQQDEAKTDDSNLQMNDQELEQFKKNIRQYIRPQHSPRTSMVIAQKQVILDEFEMDRHMNHRVHFIERPSVPRIFRIQHSLNLKQREKRSADPIKFSSYLELPSINKRYL